jgi:GGDEF domain-containing protein
MWPYQNDPTPMMSPLALCPAARRPAMLVLRGSEVGSVYRLEKPEIIVGRDGGADIRFPHPTVSRRHARLRVSADRVVVEDLGSSNGTYVGFDLLECPRQLEEGDRVGFGSFALVKLTRSHEGGTPRCRPVSAPARIVSRAHLLELLDTEIAYARRHRAPLTLVFIGMDRVAAAVAAAGGDERVADQMVGKVVAAVSSVARAEEAFARSGVSELVAIVRGDEWAGAALAERVRRAVDARADFPDDPLRWQTVTGAVVPIKPLPDQAQLLSATARGSPADRILATACAMAARSSRETPNRVIRLAPLTV